MHNVRSLVPNRLARVVTLLALAAALIVGLLSMHATGPHSAAALPPAASHLSHSTTAAHDEQGSMLVGTSAVPCEGACTGGEHDMAMTACILALLVLLLFVAPALLRQNLLQLLQQVTPPKVRDATAAPARPPSLAVLSISRR